jgi:hypothetical protein
MLLFILFFTVAASFSSIFLLVAEGVVIYYRKN